MQRYNVAVVGATGLVGRKVVKVLEELSFPINKLRVIASKRSAGKRMDAFGSRFIVEELNPYCFLDVDISFFCAGREVAEKYTYDAISYGSVVIDNSSAFRRKENVPLIVPEINMECYRGEKLIANPNCSTIQAVLPLYPLHKKFGIKRVSYSTYQAVSGSGQKGINDLNLALTGNNHQFYPYDISKSCIPEIGVFLQNGYTEEEDKMIFETKKILSAKEILVSATCVRVPVRNCHAINVVAEIAHPFNIDEVKAIIAEQEGVVVVDNPRERVYPIGENADGSDKVLVGRIRRDLSVENGITFYCVADNLRKGAASNAVQIAKRLVERGLLK